MAGKIAHTIAPLDHNCPEIIGCQLLVSTFSVAVNDFDTVDRTAPVQAEAHVTSVLLAN
jgi:hypothetical protein